MANHKRIDRLETRHDRILHAIVSIVNNGKDRIKNTEIAEKAGFNSQGGNISRIILDLENDHYIFVDKAPSPYKYIIGLKGLDYIDKYPTPLEEKKTEKTIGNISDPASRLYEYLKANYPVGVRSYADTAKMKKLLRISPSDCYCELRNAKLIKYESSGKARERAYFTLLGEKHDESEINQNTSVINDTSIPIKPEEMEQKHLIVNQPESTFVINNLAYLNKQFEMLAKEVHDMRREQREMHEQMSRIESIVQQFT